MPIDTATAMPYGFFLRWRVAFASLPGGAVIYDRTIRATNAYIDRGEQLSTIRLLTRYGTTFSNESTVIPLSSIATALSLPGVTSMIIAW